VPTCRFQYRLDSKSRPKAFDFRSDGQVWRERGIYQLDGDALLICYGEPEDGRPAGFDAESGKDCRFAVLERVVSGSTATPP
jgi:hypothetical protein